MIVNFDSLDCLDPCRLIAVDIVERLDDGDCTIDAIIVVVAINDLMV